MGVKTFYSCSCHRNSLYGVVRGTNSKCVLNAYRTHVRMFGCVVFAMHVSSVAIGLFFGASQAESIPNVRLRNSGFGFNRTCPRQHPLYKEVSSCVFSPGLFTLACFSSRINSETPVAKLWLRFQPDVPAALTSVQGDFFLCVLTGFVYT